MRKGFVIAFLLGWALSVLVTPQGLWGMVRGRKSA